MTFRGCLCLCRYELQSKGRLSEEYTSSVPDIYLRNQVGLPAAGRLGVAGHEGIW